MNKLTEKELLALVTQWAMMAMEQKSVESKKAAADKHDLAVPVQPLGIHTIGSTSC